MQKVCKKKQSRSWNLFYKPAWNSMGYELLHHEALGAPT